MTESTAIPFRMSEPANRDGVLYKSDMNDENQLRELSFTVSG